ncbi:MAG TPA: alpha/beta hydrolase [Methanomassiliicoccales archaeon]|nr:alpha/beta hydrolase [Methanomassiliicoccales archaeon]
MLTIIVVILTLLIILIGALLIMSPGKTKPLLDKNGDLVAGSISEKTHVSINGVEQGMFIRSKNPANPVLLFLHGGPGMPEHFLNDRYPTGLEEHFSVCWWERRGSGLSYTHDIPPETMTVEQTISDTVEVANYLRDRFGKDKVYLMAHSGGTFFGIQAAARRPDLFHAYIALSQMANQLRSEILAYEFMLKKYRENGDGRMVRRLEKVPVTGTVPLPAAYMALRDEAMHGLGIGTTRDMRSVVRGIFFPIWFDREYTLGEKVNIWRGKAFSSRMLWDEMVATDLTMMVTKLSLPTYFISGRFDYTVSISEARSYFNKIMAPIKGFYTFEDSAHSPMFEEPDRMMKIMLEDVMHHTIALADQV